MDSDELDAAVLRVIASSGPLKACDIAAAVNGLFGGASSPITRKHVNQCLYFRLKERVVVDGNYGWSLADAAGAVAADSEQQAGVGGLQLTEAQTDIVERGSRERLLVTAAAGTGKTHVLLNRLVHSSRAVGVARRRSAARAELQPRRRTRGPPPAGVG